MAKKSVIQRALKRDRLVKKYAAKRGELKAILADPKTSEEAFYEAQRKLSKLPRSSSTVRKKNRCSISPPARLHPQVRPLPHHLPRTRPQRPDSRRHQGLLVNPPSTYNYVRFH
jgi:hypothetical protein